MFVDPVAVNVLVEHLDVAVAPQLDVVLAVRDGGHHGVPDLVRDRRVVHFFFLLYLRAFALRCFGVLGFCVLGFGVTAFASRVLHFAFLLLDFRNQYVVFLDVQLVVAFELFNGEVRQTVVDDKALSADAYIHKLLELARPEFEGAQQPLVVHEHVLVLLLDRLQIRTEIIVSLVFNRPLVLDLLRQQQVV